MQHDVAERLNKKYSGYEQHEAQKNFIGPCVELDSLNSKQCKKPDYDCREHGKRNSRNHALNCQHGVQSVLDRLEEILQKHGPTQYESKMGIQASTDVGIDRA